MSCMHRFMLSHVSGHAQRCVHGAVYIYMYIYIYQVYTPRTRHARANNGSPWPCDGSPREKRGAPTRRCPFQFILSEVHLHRHFSICDMLFTTEGSVPGNICVTQNRAGGRHHTCRAPARLSIIAAWMTRFSANRHSFL